MATTPIVTEVTKQQLDALVASNGLNEGLQYKITDKGLLVTATGNNTFDFTTIKYRSYIASLSQDENFNIVQNVFENNIGTLIWTRQSPGVYYGVFPEAIAPEKTYVNPTSYALASDYPFGVHISIGVDENNIHFLILTCFDNGQLSDGIFSNTCVEVRVYN